MHLGEDVRIGYDAIASASGYNPRSVCGGDPNHHHCAHREQRGLVIEEDAVLGLRVIVLPNMTIGGAILIAGSVVTKSVPPKDDGAGEFNATHCHDGSPAGIQRIGQKNSLKVFLRLRKHLRTKTTPSVIKAGINKRE